MFLGHEKTIKQKDQDTNHLCSCRYRVSSCMFSPLTEVKEDSSQLKQNEQLGSLFRRDQEHLFHSIRVTLNRSGRNDISPEGGHSGETA